MTSPMFAFPGLDLTATDPGLEPLAACSDGFFRTGKNGVVAVAGTRDRKVEFIAFEDRTLAYVKSGMGYPAYYPVHPVRLDKPVHAVLMDLDGTSVRSEQFWIWMIQQTTGTLLGKAAFELEEADLPFVSGHSVSEHLQYCLAKYCPERNVEEARAIYYEHVHREMRAIIDGLGRTDAFVPSPGLKEFLTALKQMKIKIGLVTSGLWEKAWPEILSAFRALKMGDPRAFYDAIITAGHPLRQGETGTLGELSPKPHPWLYAEVARVGLGVNPERRHHVIGIEDSGAGICSIRLAGFSAIGMSGGNIAESGTLGLCSHLCSSLGEVLDIIR
ncbi:MAG TPA: HAD hydrolase-like protein [Acidobacteriota bacterium]|nr:HAD hydrolase-like protein [Acidobacteriota bacterium]